MNRQSAASFFNCWNEEVGALMHCCFHKPSALLFSIWKQIVKNASFPLTKAALTDIMIKNVKHRSIEFCLGDNKQYDA